jgi:hypothetical protein
MCQRGEPCFSLRGRETDGPAPTNLVVLAAAWMETLTQNDDRQVTILDKQTGHKTKREKSYPGVECGPVSRYSSPARQHNDNLRHAPHQPAMLVRLGSLRPGNRTSIPG